MQIENEKFHTAFVTRVGSSTSIADKIRLGHVIRNLENRFVNKRVVVFFVEGTPLVDETGHNVSEPIIAKHLGSGVV